MADDTPSTSKKKVEQNDPKGAILKSVKPNLMCGDAHQLSILRPTVIVDSHMHIQSGHCVPLQWFQDINFLTRKMEVSRGVIEGSGKAGGYLMDFFGTIIPFLWLYQAPFKKSKIRALTEQGAKPTIEIGDDFMKKRKIVYEKFFKKEPLYKGLTNLIQTCVVMTMDMEYAHVDGYYGLKIYNALYKTSEDIKKLEPCDYWCPVHGTWVETTDINPDSSSYGQTFTSLKKISSRDEKQYTKSSIEGLPVRPVMSDELTDQYKKSGVLIGSYFDAKTQKTIQVEVNNAVAVLTSKDETKQYEQWDKQVRDTELSVLKYPLKLLPMFHYDPRRWQTGGITGNDFPMSQVMGAGLYLGFKMYTAQGYRPLDSRLPIMEDYYVRCCENKIPIMNHGTPGGAATYEKKEYIHFRHINDDPGDKILQQGDPEAYFNEHFVSPSAWEKVLRKTISVDDKEHGVCRDVSLHNLHLCLAHFGGPTPLGKEWSEKIAKMINSGEFPHLYTDISSSFVKSEFREYFKTIIMKKENEKLKDRVLFGTDWYMTLYYDKLVTGMDFKEFCETTKKFLDDFDTSLWIKFTQHNPYRFYRLDEQIDRIKKHIFKRRTEDKAVIRELGKFGKDKIEELEKEAAYIQVANESYPQIRETQPCKT